jgi:hypothetical protein
MILREIADDIEHVISLWRALRKDVSSKNYSPKFVKNLTKENEALKQEILVLKDNLNREKIAYQWFKWALFYFFIGFSVLVVLDVLNKLESDIVIKYLEMSSYPVLAIIVGMLLCHHTDLRSILGAALARFVEVPKSKEAMLSTEPNLPTQTSVK